MDQVAEALRERGWPFTRPAACRLEGRLVIHGCSVRFALAVSARRGLVRYRFWRADDASGLVQLTYPLLSGTDAKLQFLFALGQLPNTLLGAGGRTPLTQVCDDLQSSQVGLSMTALNNEHYYGGHTPGDLSDPEGGSVPRTPLAAIHWAATVPEDRMTPSRMTQWHAQNGPSA